MFIDRECVNLKVRGKYDWYHRVVFTLSDGSKIMEILNHVEIIFWFERRTKESVPNHYLPEDEDFELFD